jgi:hypothetical protein
VKPIKFVLLALGVLCAIAVFLPFVSVEGISASLWSMRGQPNGGGAPYVALVGSLGLIAIAGAGVAKGKFGRGLAAAGLVLGAIVAAITIVQFKPEMPFGKFAGLGAQILLIGGAIAAVAGLVGVIKPERSSNA